MTARSKHPRRNRLLERIETYWPNNNGDEKTMEIGSLSLPSAHSFAIIKCSIGCWNDKMWRIKCLSRHNFLFMFESRRKMYTLPSALLQVQVWIWNTFHNASPLSIFLRDSSRWPNHGIISNSVKINSPGSFQDQMAEFNKKNTPA